MKYIVLLLSLLVVGCEKAEKQKHSVSKSGNTEFGVRIEVMLSGGGTATLVCPRYKYKPQGAHGRECYLDWE